MPATTTTTRRPTRVDGNGVHRSEPTRPPSLQRRRRTTAAIVSVLCIAGGALAGVVAFKAGSDRVSVLATSHALTAGHILEPGDLRVVDVSSDGGLGLLLASSESSIVGRPLAVPVAAGAPLVSSDVGATAAVGPGQAVVGVLCKAGQFPPSLAAGDTVEIVDAGVRASAGGTNGTPTLSAGSAAVASLIATVVGIDAPSDTATVGTIVSLRLSASDAPSVARAAAAGTISLILLPPGG